MAVRPARRRPGLFPSMRHSSSRSGAAAAVLERRLRGSVSPPQQHRIAAPRRGGTRAGRRGQGAAPLAAVRSNVGAARPLEKAAIFSCHGEAGAEEVATGVGLAVAEAGRRREGF